MVRTTFGGFMCLSVHCARCHDHKFDPITRMDYYRTVGMFFGYVNYDHLLVPKQQADEFVRTRKEILKAMAPLKEAVAQLEVRYEKRQFEASLKRVAEESREAVREHLETR